MDGDEGKQHPWHGARIAEKLMRWLGHGDLANRCAAVMHVLGHSRSFCRQYGFSISPLCAPDKLSVLLEPSWFYFLRASLSGEIIEFVDNARRFGFDSSSLRSRWQWVAWYKQKVANEFKTK